MADMGAEIYPVACRIDTLVRTTKETDKVEICPIFETDRTHLGLEKLSGFPVDIVYGAWARLLRSYVHRDTVSFGLLSTSGDEGVRSIRDVRSFSIKVDRAQICQYYAISERTWGEWLPDACQDISSRAVEQTPINTAVLVDLDQQDSRPQRGDKYIASEMSECVSRCILLNLFSFKPFWSGTAKPMAFGELDSILCYPSTFLPIA